MDTYSALGTVPGTGGSKVDGSCPQFEGGALSSSVQRAINHPHGAMEGGVLVTRGCHGCGELPKGSALVDSSQWLLVKALGAGRAGGAGRSLHWWGRPPVGRGCGEVADMTPMPGISCPGVSHAGCMGWEGALGSGDRGRLGQSHPREEGAVWGRQALGAGTRGTGWTVGMSARGTSAS